MERCRLGPTEIEVTPIALGCWPISGMSSVDVNDEDSLATLHAALDEGINFLDTAYAYGAQGESERLIARACRNRRDELVIATKSGIHWDENVERVFDGSPERIIQECDESLQRLATDRVELLYLHAPDPAVPVAESAGGYKRLLEAGKTRSVGVSNLTVAEMEAFAAECPIAACQVPYNMLQRDIEDDIVPWCRERNIALCIYWPLMKGLLAGHMPRDFVFHPGDGRAKYPMFQGEEWEKNQDFLDTLRTIAAEIGKSVAQVVINWTLLQPGITAALCGAKRAYQIRDNAQSVGWELTTEQLAQIDVALKRRGKAATRLPV